MLRSGRGGDYHRAVLNLASATPSDWVDRVVPEIDELLVDHAHCEKKAAGMALNLMFRYPQYGFLMRPLSELAREELRHFEAVLRILEARGSRFRIQRPSAYAGRLRETLRAEEPGRLIDTLLCCALIEARSSERFGLLAEAAPDAELRRFYAGLLASEARHHRIYVELASRVEPGDAVRSRLERLAAHEARVLAEVAPLPRMHA